MAPATFTGAIDSDWTKGGNWNTGVVPGPKDSAFFTATYNVACGIPAGIGVNIAGLSIAAGYTKTITLNSTPGPLALAATLGVSGLSILDGGEIDQTAQGCTITLGGGTWDGTVLNGTTTCSSIFLNDNLTVKGAAWRIGSNLYIQNNSTVDWQATNTNVTVNNAAVISVSQGSTLSFPGDDSGGGVFTEVTAGNGNSYVDNYGLVQRTGGDALHPEDLGMPMIVESGGRLWVQDSRGMEIDGSNGSTNNVSLYQLGGTTDIGSTGGTALTILTLEQGADAMAGCFETLGTDGRLVLDTAGSQLKISGTTTLQICPGGTAFGIFWVTGIGDVNLDGGTFAVWGKVGTGYDQLSCDGNIMINNASAGCTLSVHTNGTPIAGTDWIALQARAGKSITGDFFDFNWNGGYNWNHKNNGTTYDLTA